MCAKENIKKHPILVVLVILETFNRKRINVEVASVKIIAQNPIDCRQQRSTLTNESVASLAVSAVRGAGTGGLPVGCGRRPIGSGRFGAAQERGAGAAAEPRRPATPPVDPNAAR